MPASAQPRLVACPRAERVAIPDEVLSNLSGLYRRGQFVDAYRATLDIAPLQDWAGSSARLFASRLASRLQGHRLAHYLCLSAWHESPRDANACLYRGYWLWPRRGPLAVWEFTRDWSSFSNLDLHAQSSLVLLRARVAAHYRDFSLAWRLADEATRLDPEDSWTWCERAEILLAEDRVPEATEAVERAQTLQPWYFPAVQIATNLLMRQGRVEEATTHLKAAGQRLQSAEIVARQIALQRELDDSRGMMALLDQYQSLAPLSEPEDQQWLAARRCDAYCLEQAWDQAATEAERAAGPYAEVLAPRLRSKPPVSRRVRLSLPRIVQKHNTCGPSTLAMLARHWGMAISDDAIAEAISLDGTTDHRERRWCLDQGLHAREFRLTWDSGRALLDAGIPFALATVEVNSAHMQAVVGYDQARESFLIQDPSSFLYVEAMAQPFLEEYALHGPRALALVPANQRARLDGIALPDVAIFDHVFDLRTALFRHDRSAAVSHLDAIATAAPDHSKLWWAKVEMAWYDGNLLAEDEAIAALERLHPGDPRLHARRTVLLRELGSRDDLTAFLRKAAKAKRTDPSVWRDLARVLDGPACDEDEAWAWLLKAHAAMPFDTEVAVLWGQRQWVHGHKEAAVEAFGFASTLAPLKEHLALTWFDAAHMTGRRQEALERLRERHRRWGAKSAEPSRTLLWILDRLYQDQEAAQVLAQALTAHPDDGALLLDATWMATRQDKRELAQQRLAEAEKHNPRGPWLTAKAQLHERFGEHPAALAAWREIAEREPTSPQAQDAVARLLSVLEGEGQARAHLEGAVQRFPHHVGLRSLLLEWLRTWPLGEAEAAARAMCRLHPRSDWAARELAIILRGQGRFKEALAEAERALALNARSAAAHGIQASILQSLGRVQEARAAYRQALTLDVDYAFAMGGLLDEARDTQQRREALDFIHGEIVRQVLTGAAIDAYCEHAFTVLEHEVLLEQLKQIHQARPDLYQSWASLVAHLGRMGRQDEAQRLAEEATDRFARLPGAWLTLARIHRDRLEWSAALTCLRTACELNPDWPVAWFALADTLEDSGDSGQALAMLERAIRRLPGASNLAVQRASLLWRMGQRQEALEAILAALVRFPKDEQAWHGAEAWAETLGRQEEVVAAANRLVRERPGEAESWLQLCRCLPRAAMEEKLAALDKALDRDPRNLEVHDLKAQLLSEQARTAEARAACRPPCFGDDPPCQLRGRALWITFHDGKRKEALTGMQALLRENSDYLWGWQQLLDWAEEMDDQEIAAQARTSLLRLAPDSLATLCAAGEAKQLAGDDKAALVLYERALALYPASITPLRCGLAILWHLGDTQRLRELAGRALPGATATVAQMFMVLADIREGKRDTAKTRLEGVVASAEPVSAALDDLDRGLCDLGWWGKWQKALTRAVRRGTIGMPFASIWVKREAEAGRWSAWRYFADWIARGNEDAALPIETFFIELGVHKAARKAKGLWKSSASAWVRARTHLLGQASYALASSGMWGQTIDWLQGAMQREDLEPWIANNLILACSELGREDEASRVAMTIYARKMRGHSFSAVAAQVAYAHAHAGELQQARTALEDVVNEGLGTIWAWKAALARELADVLSLQGEEAARRQKAAIKTMKKEAFARVQRLDRTMLRLYRATLRAMRRHSKRRPWPWDYLLRGRKSLWHVLVGR
jgi:cellulose synthase operon protein C